MNHIVKERLYLHWTVPTKFLIILITYFGWLHGWKNFTLYQSRSHLWCVIMFDVLDVSSWYEVSHKCKIRKVCHTSLKLKIKLGVLSWLRIGSIATYAMPDFIRYINFLIQNAFYGTLKLCLPNESTKYFIIQDLWLWIWWFDWHLFVYCCQF